MTRYIFCSLIILFFISCKKTKNGSMECSQIYGYALSKYSSGVFQSCSFGTINTSTASITPFATFPANIEKRCAFNSHDNCYYIYQGGLYKIGQDGKTMALETANSIPFETLIYNSHNNKFYATGESIVELEVTGNKYTEKTVASFIHDYTYSSSLTVDNNGDIYYVTTSEDPISHPRHTYYIEKYHPGDLSPIVIASDTTSSKWLFYIAGLAFNKNDNMLYAIRQVSSITGAVMDFIRIDPSKGLITKLSNKFLLSSFIDENRYSVCIDPCTNHYIIAQSNTFIGGASTLDQIDMSGTVVQHKETDLIFMGLSVK